MPAPSPLLLLLLGHAWAGLSVWPSLHVALSSSSVFVDFRGRCDGSLRLSLVHMETNTTIRTRTLPGGRPSGRTEFNCSCFLFAGTFRFLLQQTCPASNGSLGPAATQWWSSELRVQWPTFHIAVERAVQSQSFQVRISTSEHFQPCPWLHSSALHLEVSYLQQQKVQARSQLPVLLLKSQVLGLPCAVPFTDRDFVRLSLRSAHQGQEVKGSDPLHLTRLFPYKLLVENGPRFRSGCDGELAVELTPPPCARVAGEVLLLKDGVVTPLASGRLAPGRTRARFNCSLLPAGRSRYCVRFVPDAGAAAGPAPSCLVVDRTAESWGSWLQWSVCSATCGEGVRERARECVLPPGAGVVQCSGMVKEQSRCSLEACAAPPPAATTPSPLGGGTVAVGGISLCLAVIVATVVVTLWRKLCRAPPCSPAHRGSSLPPGGRKPTDEASICGPPVRSEGPPPDPERRSPSGQKMLPTVFGYRLAQQQLKQMKKVGLKEATQLYHVSSSPVQATPTASPLPSPTAFMLPALPPELRPSEAAFCPGAPPGLPGPSGSCGSRERTAEWVQMVERSRLGAAAGPGRPQMNPSFRRTSSFNAAHPQTGTAAQFRERSLTQVGSRTLPEGSSWTRRVKEQPYFTIPENECPQPGLQTRTWLDRKHAGTSTRASSPGALQLDLLAPRQVDPGVSGIGGPLCGNTLRVDRAEQNWSRRGPSPVQRNLLARKLKEAQASASSRGRRRSATFSASPSVQRRDAGDVQRRPDAYRSLDRSQYRLSEAERRMLDLDLPST